MPLSLKEMCYLRITGNVNSQKLPGKCEKRDHQYLWRRSKCKLSHHTCKQLCYWHYISTRKRHKGESDDRRMISVCVGGTIFHKMTAEAARSCPEPVALWWRSGASCPGPQVGLKVSTERFKRQSATQLPRISILHGIWNLKGLLWKASALKIWISRTS